jgi:thiamine pyrophosphate-dependent acetolactate synthase large subunit-like protein
VLVIKNNMLNQVGWEQILLLGDPQFGCELQPIDFALAAGAMGGRAFSVTDSAQAGGVVDAAFSTEEPVVIAAVVASRRRPCPDGRAARGPPCRGSSYRPTRFGRSRMSDPPCAMSAVPLPG